MSEALYRKYRPQTFEDVVGQEHIERTIKNAIEQDKVSHAYLFCGPRGTGKTTTARLLAKALLCEGGPTADPDGTCEDCQLIAAGEHPDVYELDAASRTGVNNVREEIDQSRAVRADARALQGLHHRRGSHALGGGVQRTVEDARGAAEPCGVHPGDDRPAEGSRDHPFPLPAIRFPPHLRRGHGRAFGRGMRVRRGRVRGRGARFDRRIARKAAFATRSPPSSRSSRSARAR